MSEIKVRKRLATARQLTQGYTIQMPNRKAIDGNIGDWVITEASGEESICAEKDFSKIYEIIGDEE